NDGAGVFTNYYSYGTSGNPIGVAPGDFNGDGRPDLAFCHYYGNIVSTWVGSASNPLLEDPPGSGLRTAFGRGNRSNSSDVDFWQFSGNAGDQCIVAVDTVGNPGNSQLYFQIQQADGSVMHYPDGSQSSWYPANNGWGQSGVVTLPRNGNYFVRVAANYDYQGEYRLRVTLARPPVQLTSESNTGIGSAWAVPLKLASGSHLTSSTAGYLSVGDGADYYTFGNLLGGTTLSVGFRQPSSSGIAPILYLYNSAGALMTNTAPGATNLVFTIPPGSNGVYYAAISAAQAAYPSGLPTAISFNGSSSYVDVGAWTAGTQWTLQAWANPSSLPGGRRAIVGAASQCLDWSIVLQDGQFGINLTPPGSCNTLYRSGDPVTPGQWYQVTATCDGTNASLYVNGQLRVSGASATYTGTAQGTRIGSHVCCGDYFPGLMRDVRIWNRPLTASEIATNIYATLTGSEPNLLGYWPCGEGSGPTTADLSTFNHAGTLAGGAAWVTLGPPNVTQPSLKAQYLLNFDLTCPTPPVITAVSLPANNTTNSGIISGFTVGFNEDLDPRFTWLSRSVSRFNGHSYVLTDAATDWASAEAAAVALGGHLATINSADENNFLYQAFSRSANVWIGLNLFTGGQWVWSSGDPVSYLNWAGGQPNNGNGYEFATQLRTDGGWEDIAYWTSLRGIVEVASTTDADGDGLVDSLDPYPNDPLNGFDLRAAGPDGAFDTADDIRYHVYSTGYSSGLSSGFAIADGPLQPGNYRFQVTTALRDRFANGLPAAHVQYFTIAAVAGFVEENQRTNGVSTTSLAPSASGLSDGSFAYTFSAGVGAQPYYVAQADFNGDVFLDVVTANWNAGGVTVLTNDTHGNFVVATNIATGPNPPSVITSDFNRDGKADLAVANWSSGTVTILLGDGAAGFTLATNLPGFTNPWNLTAADFNHDGVLDLAVPSYYGGRVTVLLGDGTGNFTNAVNYTVGSNPETVRSGDLDGDGNPDLVVANYGSSTFNVLLGSTNGDFTLTTNYATVSNPRYTALADVNGDGKLDAITVNNGNYVSVAFGNGDGTFQSRTDYNIGSGDTYQVVVADLNHDGKPDLIIPGYGVNRLFTMLNNGDGTFGSTLTYNNLNNFGGNPISAVVGDYNHDGRLDIATVTWNGNNVAVLLGNNTEGLPYDPAGTGLRIVAGRGNLADSGDLSYWTFSAQANDRLLIAAECPGNPAASQLLFRIYY
ncbi:MAG: FG-GAP-like repeat-containing protein, partial [Verrucomicrobiota bacterium]